MKRICRGWSPLLLAFLRGFPSRGELGLRRLFTPFPRTKSTNHHVLELRKNGEVLQLMCQFSRASWSYCFNDSRFKISGVCPCNPLLPQQPSSLLDLQHIRNLRPHSQPRRDCPPSRTHSFRPRHTLHDNIYRSRRSFSACVVQSFRREPRRSECLSRWGTNHIRGEGTGLRGFTSGIWLLE